MSADPALDPNPIPVCVLFDHDGLRRALARAQKAPPDAGEVAAALVRLAASRGRLSLGAAYADWSAPQADAQAVQERGLEPVVVSPGLPGASTAALAFDAAAHVTRAPEGTHVILAGGDAVLGLLARRLRAEHAHVTLVGPASLAEHGAAAGAHAFLTLEALLRGEAGAPAHASAPAPGGSVFDPETYDWRRLLRLVAWLERRLPFVGVGYLIKKAMNPDNVGAGDPRAKQQIFQEAQDRGFVEVYYKENIEEDADPVAACRLVRGEPLVEAVLADLEEEG